MTEQLDIKVGDRVLIEAEVVVHGVPGDIAIFVGPMVNGKAAFFEVCDVKLHSILSRKLRVGDRVFLLGKAGHGEIIAIRYDQVCVDWGGGINVHALASLTVAPKDPFSAQPRTNPHDPL